jgi:hypothetical protein
VQQFSADQQMWIELIAYAEGLFEGTVLLMVDTNVLSLPFRFEDGTIRHNDWAKIFLQNYFALQLNMLRPDLELAIQRRSKDIRDRI